MGRLPQPLPKPGRSGLVTVELAGPARSRQQVPPRTEIIVTAVTAGSRTADSNPVNNSAEVIVGLDNVSLPPQEVAP